MAEIALVGAGNMGFAMLKGWLAQTPHHFTVIEPSDELRARAEGAGASAFAREDALPADYSPDAVIVATKPQVVGKVAERYMPRLSDRGLFISVAAGVAIRTIAECTGDGCAIIRAMPNTPALVGEGMTVCCPNQRVTTDQRRLAEDLLSAIGRVVFVDDEGLMDAVTAVSGSGPAYFFHFIEALTQAGVRAGLDAPLALLLARQTAYGAAKLAEESEDQPSELRQRVTSPNGTTAAALDVLMRPDTGLSQLLTEAVDAARRRSVELGG